MARCFLSETWTNYKTIALSSLGISIRGLTSSGKRISHLVVRRKVHLARGTNLCLCSRLSLVCSICVHIAKCSHCSRTVISWYTRTPCTISSTSKCKKVARPRCESLTVSSRTNKWSRGRTLCQSAHSRPSQAISPKNNQLICRTRWLLECLCLTSEASSNTNTSAKPYLSSRSLPGLISVIKGVKDT